MSALLPIRAQSYEELRDQRIEESRDRAKATLARTVAAYEAATGKPFRDPEPTPAEVATARRKADEAMRGLIGLLPLTEDERRFVERRP